MHWMFKATGKGRIALRLLPERIGDSAYFQLFEALESTSGKRCKRGPQRVLCLHEGHCDFQKSVVCMLLLLQRIR